MFKHLLLPIDGTALSESAFRKAIALAREMNARVTALRVIPDYHHLTMETETLAGAREQYAREARQSVERYLTAIAQDAAVAGVTCETAYEISDHPYEEIIKAATYRECDLIVMASHGRRGIQGILIGSETQKVLTHSKIPVLVYR
ncbi:universal stress protein [Cupriavidus sp. TMH.W2]|uniref:universal stress protein n=1 Tax=Cupriavidus sp. TMH.W2 TaxID=3434465 RepID=UPI003D775339